MTPCLDLNAIKDRADRSINTAAFDGSDDEYEHAVQFVLDHQRLIDEVDRLCTELYVRDLALAMARGDRWPPGWAWSEQDEGFRSPNNDAYITMECINHLGSAGMEGAPIGWRLYWRDEKIRGLSIGNKVVYPDALAALRAHQAGVQS